MENFGMHLDPTAPQSLNAEKNFTINATGCKRITIQANLTTSPSAKVHYKLNGVATETETTIANFKPEGVLTNLGSVPLFPSPVSAGQYLHLLITNSSDVATNGGANDYVFIMKEG